MSFQLSYGACDLLLYQRPVEVPAYPVAAHRPVPEAADILDLARRREAGQLMEPYQSRRHKGDHRSTYVFRHRHRTHTETPLHRDYTS